MAYSKQVLTVTESIRADGKLTCFPMPGCSGNLSTSNTGHSGSAGSGGAVAGGGGGMNRRRSSLGQQSGCEALHDSVAKGKLHLTRFILEAVDCNKEVVDFQDEHGKTALIRACKIREMRTQLRMAELLLERGASVNLRDNVGKTVLHYACELHANNLVKLLIKNAANPDLPDNDGCTPLILCARVGNDIGTEILVKCFRKLGLNTDHEDSEGLTALMTACKEGYLECSRILIHKGKASLTKKDKYHGMTAVDWARSDGCSEEEIETMLQKPSLEDMEFPDPKQVLENLSRKNQRAMLMRKQKSELHIPELDLGSNSGEDDMPKAPEIDLCGRNDLTSSFGYQRMPADRKKNPRRRKSNLEFVKTSTMDSDTSYIEDNVSLDPIGSIRSTTTLVSSVDQPVS